jgi:alpha-tubulin suppressor-like RCC1 family protein
MLHMFLTGHPASLARDALLALTAALAVVALAATPGRAATIAVGETQACGTSAAGAVTCWGGNSSGSLGNGGVATASRTDSFDPVGVVGLESGVTDLQMSFTGNGGSTYGCALQGGAAKCWGVNGSGTLGDGTTAPKAVATPVSGLGSGVTAIDTSASRACAVQNGAAKCWGGGYLGDGTTADSPVPVQVQGFEAGTQGVATGWRHLCALKAGAPSCWGATAHGSLGHDQGVNYQRDPYPVQNLPGPVAKIVAGTDVTCTLQTTGAVYCWGSDGAGKRGDGGAVGDDDTATPTPVAGLQDGVTDLAANYDHLCALRAGVAYCWGENEQGQLGNGTATDAPAPVAVSGLTNVTSIAVGKNVTCATVGGAQQWCWGLNSRGNLGNEAAGSRSLVPVPVIGSTPKPPAAPIVVRPPVVVKPPVVVRPPAAVKPKPTITGVTRVRLDSRRRAAVATISCPAGPSACAVTAPKSLSLKIGRKSYSASVTAAKTIKAGKQLTIRIALGRSAASNLAGRTTRATLRLVVVGNGARVSKTVSTTVAGAAPVKARPKGKAKPKRR